MSPAGQSGLVCGVAGVDGGVDGCGRTAACSRAWHEAQHATPRRDGWQSVAVKFTVEHQVTRSPYSQPVYVACVHQGGICR